jgi:hypothetical protein
MHWKRPDHPKNEPMTESEKAYDNNLSMGFVKLYRAIEHKAWYKKSEHVHLFIHLLIKASHSGYEAFFNGFTKKLQPGQLVTGRNKLVSETGIERNKVERILKLFENEHQIEQVTTSTSRLITICNWEVYQKGEHQSEQRVSSDRAAGEQRVSTKQEGLRKDKKVDKVKNTGLVALINPFSESFLPTWARWKDYRLELKKPITPGAEQNAIDQLHKISAGSEGNAGEIISTSIANGWRGLFPLTNAAPAPAEKSIFKSGQLTPIEQEGRALLDLIEADWQNKKNGHVVSNMQ